VTFIKIRSHKRKFSNSDSVEQNSSLFDEFLCKLGFFGTSGPVMFRPTSAKKDQFTQERVEYKVFLFDEPLKGSKSLKTRGPLKRSFHSRFKLAHSCQKTPIYTRTRQINYYFVRHCHIPVNINIKKGPTLQKVM
jgi:hypothetical protein